VFQRDWKIWDKETWDNYSNEAQGDYEELAEKMMDFEINF
jgi:DNA-binding transcriptional regulator/RsmH inhibitor MraZ